MKSITMYMFKKRFRPLVWLLFLLLTMTSEAQTYIRTSTHSMFYTCDFYRTEQNSSTSQISLPGDYSSLTNIDFINVGEGTYLPLGDDETKDIPITGFPFKFFCSDVTSLRVGTDGALLVNSSTGNLPSSNPTLLNITNIIAPWWGTWNTGQGQVRYIRKSNPDRLDIQFSDISPYSSSLSTDILKATFRVVLYSENNVDSLKSNIAFYYQDVNFESDALTSTVAIENFAKSMQNASKGAIGLRGLCLSGSIDDKVNPIVKNENDGNSLYSIAFDQLIRAVIFKPDLCEFPKPLTDTAVCQGSTSFIMPSNNTMALKGEWSSTTPNGLSFLNRTNSISAKFNPLQPGFYEYRWNPGCVDYGFDVKIRVDDSLSILTPVPNLSGCGQTTFTVQGETPSVLTAGNPVWTKTSGTLTTPTFPLSTPPYSFTATGVEGDVFLKYTNGVCVSDVTLRNLPVPPPPPPAVVSVCGSVADLEINPAPPPTASEYKWTLLNAPSGVTFNPISPTSSAATVTGLLSAGSVEVNVGYRIGDVCKSQSFTVNGASPPPATINNGSGNKNQTITQCGNDPFTLTGDIPTDPNFVGEWKYATSLPSGVGPSVLSGNTVTITGVPTTTDVKLYWIVRYNTGNVAACNDTVTVTLINIAQPTANAGVDQPKCNNGSFTLAANDPASPMVGRWTVVSPLGFSTNNISNVNQYNATVSNVPLGTSVTLRWTVTNPPCTSSSDDVILTNNGIIAIAGGNQTKCSFGNTSFTMAANTPSVGSGEWSIVSSTPAGFLLTNVAPLASPSAVVSNVPVGTSVTLRWTTTNGSCTSNSTVTVTNNQNVTASITPVEPRCTTSTFDLTANPTVLPTTGTWSVVSPSTFVLNSTTISPNVNSPIPTISGVPSNVPVVLRWTVTNANGTCSSSADVTLNNVPSAKVVLKDFNCPNTTDINLDNLLDTLIGNGVWSAVGTSTGTFSGSNHPVVNGAKLNGTTNYTTYTPTSDEIACGEINLQISVTNVCTTIPIVRTIKILLGTAVVVPANLNLSLDYNDKNCERILTGNFLCQNNYKHYTLRICRIGIVPADGKCECNAFSYIPNNKIDASLIGQTIGVELSDACGNKATSCVKIEDKQPPIIVCPKDVSVYCNTQVALSSDNPLPIVTGDLGLDNIIPTANGAMDGSVKDCSSTQSSFEDCEITTGCTNPFTDTNRPALEKVLACLKVGENVDKNLLANALRNRMITTSGDVIKFIIRRWVAIDQYGNISESCYQIIAIRRLPFTIVAPADVKYSCNGAITDCTPTIPAAPASLASSVTGYPFVDINGNGMFDIIEDIVLNTAGARACGITVNEKNDTFPTCKGSRKIVRTFTIYSACNNITRVVTQNIELLDLTPPVVRSEYLNYERVAKKYCYIDPFLGKVDKISYDLVAKQEVLDNFLGKQIVTCNSNTEGPKKTLFAIGDANDCNKFFVKFTFTACDHYCTKDSVTITSNLGSTLNRTLVRKFVDANGVPNYVWEFSGFVTAQTFDDNFTYGEGECQKQGAYCKDITFTAKDNCGNAYALQTFRVYLIDNQKPQMVCKPATASLGTGGTDRITAATFNNGTTDNCGVAGFRVRRMDQKYFDPATIDGFDCAQPALKDTCFRDYVEFTCQDVDSTIMVELLAYDDNCNTNTCMVEVKVQNKSQPTCAAPTTPTTVSCTDIDKILLNPSGFFTTTASGFYNCGYDVKEIKPEIAVNNCGIGTVTRTWNVVKCDDKTILKSCQQIIQVTGKSDFSVDFPDDIVVSCQGEIPTIECLKEQMLDPKSWDKYDGAIKNNACGVLQISITDVMAMANPNGLGCSVIYRKICVSDDCKYQPNGSDGLTKGLALAGDTHGYATNGKSLPCSVRGATTKPLSENRRFRDADGLTGTGNSDGIICYIQTIKIEDVTKPVATILGDTTIGLTPKQCKANHRRTISATDGCTPTVGSNSGLRYNWFVVLKEINKDPNSLTQIASGETNIIAVDNLAAGTYTVLYSVKDLCNNSTPQYSYTLTVRDNEAASIVSRPKKIAALGGIANTNNGMATVCVFDFWMSANDNCTSEKTLRLNARLVRETPTNKVTPVYPSDTCVMVTCVDVGKSIPVQLWTKDEAGNINFAIDTIVVQDNNSPKVCTTVTGMVATAQGFIVNDKNVAIQNAQISASMRGVAASPNVVMTSNTGGFEINNLILGQGYDFKVAKEDEVYAGVTTLDISLISRHLLEIDKLKTPCSIIAADVDGNRVVDGADMLHVRNFILRKTSSLPAGAWRFVDKKYNFINPNEPLAEDFPQIVSVTNVAQNYSLGFTAVKVGDVNNTYRPQTIVAPAPRSSNTLTFVTDDIQLEAGKTYSIKLKSSDFKAADYQFTLGFAEGVATIKSVDAGNLPNMGNNNFAIFKNAITTSWNGASKDTEVEAMTLTFVANQQVKLSEVLTINSSITPSDATNTEGPSMKIQLIFGNNAAKDVGEFALYQNRPNPMFNSTAIGFNLPKEGEATLTIYNIEGKAMKVVNSTFKAGYNEVMVEKETFQTAGVYYYRLETSEHSATKKMVVSF
jgi:hypothetical protein